MIDGILRRMRAKTQARKAADIARIEREHPGELRIERTRPVKGEKAPDITTAITYVVYAMNRAVARWNPDPGQEIEPAQAIYGDKDVKGALLRGMIVKAIEHEAREALVDPRDMTPEQRLRGPVFVGGQGQREVV